MNKIKYMIGFILTASMLLSCSDDSNPRIDLGDITAIPAQIVSPASGTSYEFKKDNYYNTFQEFEVRLADFGLPLGQRHTLQVDLVDNNFEEPVTVTSSSSNTISVILVEMNAALHQLGVEELGENESGEKLYAPLKVKVRVATNAFGGEEGVDPIEGAATLYSDPIEITITPCEDLKPAYPAELYMTGEEFGNWDWESQDVMQMIPVNDKPSMFWGINYFTADKVFKWAPQRAWANDFAGLETNEGFTVKDGNASVSSNGLYMVFIDFAAQKVIMEPAVVYGLGACFGDDWGTGTAFVNNDKVTTVTTTHAGELRLYAKPLGSGIDWWRQEFIILDGKIEYRGNGGDQERVVVDAGKTVTLDFRAGTGTIK